MSLDRRVLLLQSMDLLLDTWDVENSEAGGLRKNFYVQPRSIRNNFSPYAVGQNGFYGCTCLLRRLETLLPLWEKEEEMSPMSDLGRILSPRKIHWSSKPWYFMM